MSVINPIIVQAGGIDPSDANAAVGDVLAAKTFYAGNETKKTGTMVDRGTASTDITTKAQQVTIAAGKHSGSGIVKISATEQAKIIADNIKSGVTILGQAGGSTIKNVSDTTATAADVSVGKYFYTAAGVKTEGTATGGGSGVPVLSVESMRIMSTVNGSTLRWYITSNLANMDIFFDASGNVYNPTEVDIKIAGVTKGKASVNNLLLYTTVNNVDGYVDFWVGSTKVCLFGNYTNLSEYTSFQDTYGPFEVKLKWSTATKTSISIAETRALSVDEMFYTQFSYSDYFQHITPEKDRPLYIYMNFEYD